MSDDQKDYACVVTKYQDTGKYDAVIVDGYSGPLVHSTSLEKKYNWSSSTGFWDNVSSIASEFNKTSGLIGNAVDNGNKLTTKEGFEVSFSGKVCNVSTNDKKYIGIPIVMGNEKWEMRNGK